MKRSLHALPIVLFIMLIAIVATDQNTLNATVTDPNCNPNNSNCDWKDKNIDHYDRWVDRCVMGHYLRLHYFTAITIPGTWCDVHMEEPQDYYINEHKCCVSPHKDSE